MIRLFRISYLSLHLLLELRDQDISVNVLGYPSAELIVESISRTVAALAHLDGLLAIGSLAQCDVAEASKCLPSVLYLWSL